MKKLLLVVALALTCASVSVPRASAQSAAFVFAPVSGDFANAAPGSTITFSINLMFTAGGIMTDVNGLTYFLQQNEGAPFPLTITGRDIGASPFSDLITTNVNVFANGPQLNPINDRDLGGLSSGPMGSNTYFIANITLTIDPSAAPGTYTFQSTDTGGTASVINNSNGDTFPIQPAMLTVTVPEPSTYALLAFATVGVAVFAYRRRATVS